MILNLPTDHFSVHYVCDDIWHISQLSFQRATPSLWLLGEYNTSWWYTQLFWQCLWVCVLMYFALLICALILTQKRIIRIIATVSVSKVQWPELSQLSLCLEFDKENLMEFSLNSLLLIHFTTVAMRLLSHGSYVTLVMWHTMTVTWHPSHHCDIMTKSCDTFLCSIL